MLEYRNDAVAYAGGNILFRGPCPGRVTAGGRSQFVPLVANDTPENRSTNRRTRIVILPKMDQFYGMIEEGLKQASQEGGK